METEFLLSLCVGIGLSAACGFRVFVPLLITSLAAHSGHLTLAPGFQWIASPAAVAAFSIATILEIAAYYVPWVDNMLDTIATPAAAVAGTIITASMVGDVSPFLKWSLAVIGGGGAAAAVQTGTVLVRGISTATTAGFANPIFATVELGGALSTSVVALVVPPLILLVLAAALYFASRRLLHTRQAHAPRPVPPVI
jgi:hypothetical protein